MGMWRCVLCNGGKRSSRDVLLGEAAALCDGGGSFGFGFPAALAQISNCIRRNACLRRPVLRPAAASRRGHSLIPEATMWCVMHRQRACAGFSRLYVGKGACTILAMWQSRQACIRGSRPRKRFRQTMNQSIDRFQDIHVHASAVREWHQTYSQITAGALESSLIQLNSARCHVFREHINQRVVQHGEAPRGKLCFAVPIAIPGSIRMQGREADDKSIFVLRGGEEFMFHMPMGMDLLAITFEQSFFDQALADTPWEQEIGMLLRQPVIKVPQQRLEEARRRLLAIFSRALASGDAGVPPQGEPPQALEQAMLEEMLRLVTDPACDRAQRHGSSTHSFIVEKCHRLAMSDAVNVPSVMDLCERLHVSRRTVQNSFRTVAETTPLNYLRSVRLNGVRRKLMSTAASELSIGDAASAWGFFHLSHFAAEYQELFGELPSQTRRADARRMAS